MFIIKLGGSVITDKKKRYTYLEDIASRLVNEIKEAQKGAMVVHGAGSFGHILAKEFALQEGFKDQNQIQALARVQRDVKRLNLLLLNTFLDRGLDAVSLPPSTFVVNENGILKHMDTEFIKRYSEMGLVPITFGDVVLDDALKFSICSGDQLMLRLASEFSPNKVIFVADVDGIFSTDPGQNEEAELLPVVDRNTCQNLGKVQSTVDDVTGGIFGKLDIMFKIADLGLETMIINGNREDLLRDALLGKDVRGTRISSLK